MTNFCDGFVTGRPRLPRPGVCHGSHDSEEREVSFTLDFLPVRQFCLLRRKSFKVPATTVDTTTAIPRKTLPEL